MDEMRYLRQLADLPFSKALPVGTHAAVMIDETLWERHELYEENIQREFCKSLCASGIVGDIYLMTDFDAIKDKYSLFLFPQPDPRSVRPLSCPRCRPTAKSRCPPPILYVRLPLPLPR